MNKGALVAKARHNRILSYAYRIYLAVRNPLRGSKSKGVSKAYLYGRKLSGGRYSYLSYSDMVKLVEDWLEEERWDYDLIIGIPRSGLLVANLLALSLGKPLATPDSLEHVQAWVSKVIKARDPEKILLVDDSLSTGDSIRASLEKVKKFFPGKKVDTAALVVTKEGAGLVDRYKAVISQPRLFEWNLMHAKKGKMAFDLDGVIAEEIPLSLEEDPERYVRWINEAKTRFVPEYEIDYIISNRLEAYRKETEDWLSRNGVRYGELILCGAASKDERKSMPVPHKVAALLELKPDLFFESRVEEAETIAKATQIPVFCFENKSLYQ